MSGVLGYLPRGVPQILINKESIPVRRKESDGFDVELLGNCDAIIHYLCTALGWQLPPLPPRPPPMLALQGAAANGSANPAEQPTAQSASAERPDTVAAASGSDPPPALSPVRLAPRLFAFEGARLPDDLRVGAKTVVRTEPKWEELFHCDGCGRRIEAMRVTCRCDISLPRASTSPIHREAYSSQLPQSAMFVSAKWHAT